ncbi:hypothetical protein LTR46_009567 [Exophiala xenobiotica]|nr:hypothetical protein LTR06_009225 [Exophiala xenobiotica]KAK5437030.1 hypothetical protein LTR18_009395 [Exophiala xenobiotica]KAK5552520.1 hypothetical protein LTR46_009567 [Exophiala xenobiotica]
MGEAEPTPLSQQDRLAIVKGQYPGLDPEWVRLWNDHGSGMVRSDEVSPQEYRLDPAKYTLTYPLYGGPEVFHVEDREIPVSRPGGEITVRIYSPEGTGPFPVHFNFHGGKDALSPAPVDSIPLL